VNPRALIFDMDGVIVDSEALHESAKRQALRSACIEVDELVFAQYTGRSDRATHAKPSPEIFLKAIAGLELPAEDCWVIEDSVNGIVAARHAQCFAVGLTTSFHRSQLLSEGANLVVDRFSELRQLLENMVAAPGNSFDDFLRKDDP
jgi:beta-phosphoglucomutase-like phosphatase (HAD superfamily)